MKTVFKKGMKVYDQVFYPNEEGKVKKVYQDCIKVVFGGIEMSYSLDGRTTLYKEKPTLSTKPYKVQIEGFEQEAPVPIYESIRAEALKKGEYVSILNGIELPDDKTAKAFEALAKLIWLRDYYNDGWQPDWEDEEEKFSIQVCEGEFHTFESIECQRVVSFKTKEIRDKFLEEQRELLEIAKPLL